MGVKDKMDDNAVAEWGEEQRKPFKNNYQKALGEMWVDSAPSILPVG